MTNKKVIIKVKTQEAFQRIAAALHSFEDHNVGGIIFEGVIVEDKKIKNPQSFPKTEMYLKNYIWRQ